MIQFTSRVEIILRNSDISDSEESDNEYIYLITLILKISRVIRVLARAPQARVQ